MKLSDSVQYLKGVGPRMKEKLERLGIHTVEDLLSYFRGAIRTGRRSRRWEISCLMKRLWSTER